jgi:hypothetical protein
MTSLPKIKEVLKPQYVNASWEDIEGKPELLAEFKRTGKTAVGRRSINMDSNGNLNIFGTDGKYIVVNPKSMAIIEEGEIPLTENEEFSNYNFFYPDPTCTKILVSDLQAATPDFFLFGNKTQKEISDQKASKPNTFFLFDKKTQKVEHKFEVLSSEMEIKATNALWLNEKEIVITTKEGYLVHIDSNGKDVFLKHQIYEGQMLGICPGAEDYDVIVGQLHLVKFNLKTKKEFYRVTCLNIDNVVTGLDINYLDLSPSKKYVVAALFYHSRIFSEKTGECLGNLHDQVLSNSCQVARWNSEETRIIALGLEELKLFSRDPKKEDCQPMKEFPSSTFGSQYHSGFEVLPNHGFAVVGDDEGNIFRINLK